MFQEGAIHTCITHEYFSISKNKPNDPLTLLQAYNI